MSTPAAGAAGSAPAGGGGTPYFPRIDALRGLAALGVLVNHFMTFPASAYCGWLGVCLFFVLSGFLITGILLRERDRVDAAGAGSGRALAVFYARRALRIFPAYFLTLLVLYVCNVGAARALMPWMATYTYNLYGLRDWSGPYAHFWSLSVEEQFYLAWPALVFFCPRRYLVPLMAAAAALGPAWRAGCLAYGTTRTPLIIATPSCLDCLALGSLLAYFHAPGRRHTTGPRFRTLCLAAGGVLMALWLLALNLRRPWLLRGLPVEALYGNTAMAFFFTWLVGRAADAGASTAGLLGSSWLRRLGTISYGVYVYHTFMPAVWLWLGPRLPVFQPPDLYGWLGLTLLVALASWFLVEKPANGLKAWLRYGPARPAEARPDPVPAPARRAA